MSVHKKLMQARIKLQSVKLKKTGLNKFAGYSYFELSDFIPETLRIFDELDLCGFISYGTEMATLTIIDTENNLKMEITSPMSTCALKGTHAVQNLGAVQTYLRRYLWVTAMEILEHDALDSSEPEKPSQAAKKPTLAPDNKEKWEGAKVAYKRDGNLKKVLARVDISHDNQLILMSECNGA